MTYHLYYNAWAEPCEKQRSKWVAVIKYPGVARRVLTDKNGKPVRHDRKVLAVAAAFFGLIDHLNEQANLGSYIAQSSAARNKAEELFAEVQCESTQAEG